MTGPANDLLALVGISVSGYNAAELDDVLAAGMTQRIESAPEPQPDAAALETEHQRHITTLHAAEATAGDGLGRRIGSC